MATSHLQEDTEITLTTGKVLTLFFALSAVCAVFFALGFLFGKNSLKPIPEATPASQVGVAAHADAPKPSAGPQSGTLNASATAPAGVIDTPGVPPAANVSPAGDNAAPTPAQDAAAPVPNGYYVQVAAVSKQEDADALIDSLKKKQYPAFLPEPTADKLFHVQIGPFADIKDAEGIRSRLLSDGYSPIIKR
jgi:DedD protein